MSDLRIYPAAHWEHLADALADALANETGDPWTPQRVVLARPHGVLARWLRDALATRLGVVANVSLIGLEAALLERAGTAREPSALTGRGTDAAALLACLPPPGSDPAFAAIDAYLRDDRARGVASVRSVALVRELVRSLRRAAGRSPADQAVWPASHRALLDQLHVLRGARPLSERLRPSASGPAEASPLHVFGWPRPSPLLAEALFASAAHAPVSLYVLDASPTRGPLSPRHPLVAANDRLGAQALAAAARVAAQLSPTTKPAATPPRRALGRLQLDLAGTPEAPGPALPLLPKLDPSIQVHGAHGPRRQVEILHDVLLQAFEDDPSLRARDVRVLTPDLATYEPLLRARFAEGAAEAGRAWPLVFGGGLGGPPTSLTTLLEGVLALSEGRFAVAEVLALLDHAPVRARFGIPADAIGRLDGWLSAAAVRWGRDGEHRARCLGLLDSADAGAAVPGGDEGTWAFGLERLALAITSPPETGLFGGRLPIHDLEGDDARLAGALLAFARVLLAHAAINDIPADLPTWVERAQRMLETLTAPDEDDGEEAIDDPLADVRRALEEWSTSPSQGSPRLDAAGFRTLLRDADLLGEGRHGSRSGRLDATWVGPLETDTALPARVVVLLGLDDAVFPRRHHATEVAEPAGTKHPLEPDARTDDRAAFLHAILGARDALVVVAGLFDPQTNAAHPLASPLAELVTHVATLLEPAVENALVRNHPLQPFAEVDFVTQGDAAPRGHDRGALALAEALRAPALPIPGPIAGLSGSVPHLPPYTEADIDLSAMIRFFRDPVRALLRLRLGTAPPREPVGREVREPLELHGLARARLRDRFATEALASHDFADDRVIRATLRATGELPVGGAGDAILDDFARAFDGLRAAFGPRLREVRDATRAPFTTSLGSASGPRTLRGVAAGIRGAELLRAGLWSPRRPARLLEAYLTLLALRAASVETHRAELLGLDDEGVPVRVVLEAPGDPGACRAQLEAYLSVFLAGVAHPLRFGERSSFAFAETLHAAGRTTGWADVDGEAAAAALRAASRVWTTRDATGHDTGEGASVTAFAAFAGERIFHSAERPNGVDASFARIAESVYAPLLSALRVG